MLNPSFITILSLLLFLTNVSPLHTVSAFPWPSNSILDTQDRRGQSQIKARQMATVYTIVAGDTIDGMASSAGINPSALASANPTAIATDLQIGGVLTIPPASPTGSVSITAGGVASTYVTSLSVSVAARASTTFSQVATPTPSGTPLVRPVKSALLRRVVHLQLEEQHIPSKKGTQSILLPLSSTPLTKLLRP